MPNYARCIIEGTSQGGEVWSCGLSYSGATASFSQATLQAWADGVATHIESLTSANVLISMLSTAGAVTGVRCETRSNEDLLLLAAEGAVSPAKSGSSPPNKVFQSAACFSLRTPIPGRSFRGRVYWPAWNYAPTTAMRFNAGVTTDMATALVALNTAIIAAAEAAEPATGIELVVRSKVLDVETEVTSVAVGDVPDVQRRRRDDLVEVYGVVAVP